jgi:hypothetical protein
MLVNNIMYLNTHGLYSTFISLLCNDGLQRTYQVIYKNSGSYVGECE